MILCDRPQPWKAAARQSRWDWLGWTDDLSQDKAASEVHVCIRVPWWDPRDFFRFCSTRLLGISLHQNRLHRTSHWRKSTRSPSRKVATETPTPWVRVPLCSRRIGQRTNVTVTELSSFWNKSITSLCEIQENDSVSFRLKSTIHCIPCVSSLTSLFLPPPILGPVLQ